MSKNHSIILCAFFCAIVLFFSIFLFLAPKEDFSPSESRTLSKFPSHSAANIASGDFFDRFSSFCSDQFPLRSQFLSLSSIFEIGFGKLEANNVMIGKNGNLIKRNSYNDLSKLNQNLSAIENIKSFAQSKGANAVFFCAPRAVDILKDCCPPIFEGEANEKHLSQIKNAVNVNSRLTKMAKNGEYVFYKTDHHWTTLGAYEAYAVLGEYLGYTPYPLSEFSAEVVCRDFFGTSYSRVLLPNISPDTITAYRYVGDTEVKITDVSTGKTLELYDYEALMTSSKYDFFLGGNCAHLQIRSGKPRIVLIKDSFANSVIPFLSRHFDMDVIDPRYLRKPIEDLLFEIYEESPNAPMLLLFGADTLTASIGLTSTK